MEKNENEMNEDMKELSENFMYPVTHVTRHDLSDRGFDTSNIDGDIMTRLASWMEQDYLDNLFWNSLEGIAEKLGIPKKK